MKPIDAWRKALALAPKEEIYKNAVGKATWNLGLSLEEDGKHDEAQKLFDEARRLSPELAKKYPTEIHGTIQAPPAIDVPSTGSGAAPTAFGSGAAPAGSASPTTGSATQ
jgi:tetratricopeptide (TPR) repeat protein